jgi:hypothetical protein
VRAQWAVMESLAQGDVHRIEVAEKRGALCMQRLVATAHVLDCMLAERGDEDGRRRLVEPALRLSNSV